MSAPRLPVAALPLLLLFAITGCGDANDNAASGRPEVIANLERQGFEVYGEFETPGGLRAFAGLAGQHPVAIYLTPDGEHAIAGTLIDAAGNDAAADELHRLVAEPMSKKIWQQLDQSHWVRDGQPDAPRVVYVFTDPNCPYCHRFWEAARPWVEAGKVQLRHVMVGVVRPDSPNKSAAILAAEAPEQALVQNELSFDDGGIQGVAVSAETRAQLDVNERLMRELGFSGTPGILFRDRDGIVQRRSGLPMPNDMPTVMGPIE